MKVQWQVITAQGFCQVRYPSLKLRPRIIELKVTARPMKIRASVGGLTDILYQAG